MRTINYNSNQTEKCLKGSFEIEGIYMSEASRENLQKLQNGEISSEDLIKSICERYKRKNIHV